MDNQMNNQEVEQKVENKLENMGTEKKDEILSNFDQFKDYLGEKVAMGKRMGMDEEQLANAAQKVGDYLSAKEEPRNREEKLLQELWKAGSEDQRHTLAHMLIKIVA